ncbi:MAG: AAA family ATPase [Planctomycetes bacterium]|nr:AAA family ATPase [Planctomycetota bacterium]
MTTIDQATQLRRLVLRSVREDPSGGAPPPRLVVVSGARGGAGTTTMAVNLAVMAADQGTRCVLVDADLYHADVAALCGLTEQASVVDVLAARRDIHEVLQMGPAGVQVVPGSRTVSNPCEFSESGQQRLLRQLRSLGRHADVVIVDCGSSSGDVARRFHEAADAILLVVLPDAASVTDAYAHIKSASCGARKLAIGLLVNRVPDSRAGEEVHRRIASSCQRFLGFGLAYFGHVPDDRQVPDAAAVARPFVLSAPACAAAHALDSLARRLTGDSPHTGVADPGPAAPSRLSDAEKFVISSPAVADFGR